MEDNGKSLTPTSAEVKAVGQSRVSQRWVQSLRHPGAINMKPKTKSEEERPEQKKSDKTHAKTTYGVDAATTQAAVETEKVTLKKQWVPKKGRTDRQSRKHGRHGHVHARMAPRQNERSALIEHSLRDSESKIRGNKDAAKDMGAGEGGKHGDKPGPLVIPATLPKSSPHYSKSLGYKWYVHTKLPMGYQILAAAVTYKLGPEVVEVATKLATTLPNPLGFVADYVNRLMCAPLKWVVGALTAVSAALLCKNFISPVGTYEVVGILRNNKISTIDGRADTDSNSNVRHENPGIVEVVYKPPYVNFWQSSEKLVISLEMVTQLLAPQVFSLDHDLSTTQTRLANTLRTVQTINYEREYGLVKEHVKQHASCLAIAIIQEEKRRLQHLPFISPKETAWDGLHMDIEKVMGYANPTTALTKWLFPCIGTSKSSNPVGRWLFPWVVMLLISPYLIPIVTTLTRPYMAFLNEWLVSGNRYMTG